MGEVIWRMGGVNSKQSNFTFIGDSLNGFSYQHDVRRLPDSNILLYDDGNDHSPQQSRAVEYRLDETNKTATLVWEYRGTPLTWTLAMGSAQRLSNGNTIIGWGGFSALTHGITEVQADGTVVLDISFPNQAYSYRVYRFNKQGGIWKIGPNSSR